MYKKEFVYRRESKNAEEHLVGILSRWVKWTIYDYLKDDKNTANKFLKRYKTEDYKNLVTTIGLFNGIYKNKDIEELHFWSEEEFNEFIDLQRNQNKCEYCGQSPDALKNFYKLVESDNWTRGMNFEIDRRHVRLKSYLTDKEKQKNFIAEIHKFIANHTYKSDLFEQLKMALTSDTEGESYLYIPAPYNSKNCAFACYWCNNAKTDAFDDEQFKAVGLAIGETIKKII